MDAKKKIRVDSTSGPVGDEECIDLSIAYTPACSIYMCLEKGLTEIQRDIQMMEDALLKMPTGKGREVLALQVQVAKLAFTNGSKFKTELSSVIQELTKPEDKKVIIHKPNWKT